MRRVIVGLWCAAGCHGGQDTVTTPPDAGAPPTVSAMAPTSGAWGTEVTITGTGFGSQAGGIAGFAVDSGFNGDLYGISVESWSETQIVGRVAFPGLGPLVVHTAAGEVTAGTFTPDTTWTPGPGLAGFVLVDARAMSTGVLAAVHSANGLSLSVYGGAAEGVYPLGGIASPRIVEADDHTPEVIANGDALAVTAFSVAGGALVTTPTGLTGTVLAAARDDHGVYAWLLRRDGSIVRARAGATWAIDRGPLTPTYAPLDAAIAADGTLWVAISETNSDPVDREGYVSLQQLAPAATAFSAIERADPNSYDDEISQAHIVLAADGVHMVVAASRKENGVETALAPYLRTGPGAWGAAPVMGLIAYAFQGTTLAGVADDGQGAAELVPDTAAPVVQSLGVWPAGAEGLVVDGAGALRPLLSLTPGIGFGPTPAP